MSELGEGPRGAAIAEGAKDFGIAISRDYTTALAEADLVISVVTGTEAMNAAMAAKPHLRPGSIYCDFNTLTRKNAEDIGATLAAAGIDLVEVAVDRNHGGARKSAAGRVGIGGWRDT